MFQIGIQVFQVIPELKFSQFFVLGYIDPGTGSYIFQLILAALLGAGFAIRAFRSRIADLFSRLFNRSQKPTHTAAGQDESTAADTRKDASE
jgi:hypothetical protein